MIQLHQVSVSYQKAVILDKISMSFPQGKTTVLLGASGSGKSTILKVLLGLKSPDQGQISFEGSILNQQSQKQLRLQIGYMPQGSGLFPHLTIAANTTLMPRYLAWQKSRTHDRLQEVCELVQLDSDILGRYPRQVSGGQKQRAALMRALMLDPPLIVLDEPLGALDPITRFDLQHDLKRIFRNLKKTVILVTHDLVEAEYFSDLIYLMHEGRILQHGEFSELTNHPKDPYVAKFIRAQRDRGKDQLL